MQPASVNWVQLRLSSLSFVSTPAGRGSAPGGGGSATRAARPSSPSGLSWRLRRSSAGSRCKAGARATSPTSPMAALTRWSLSSRGRAPRPRAAASAEAPASPTCMRMIASSVTAGSVPAPSPAASRCTPSRPAAGSFSSNSLSSAGSTEHSVPSNARSAALLAAPQPQLEAQRCGHLMISPQLRQQRLRRRPQLIAGAAQVHGEARIEHVPQLGEEDALLVTAQLRQRHRGLSHAHPTHGLEEGIGLAHARCPRDDGSPCRTASPSLRRETRNFDCAE
eukprot:scaffold88567_cov61-Phaeocystis_antarctica.AAC.6